MLTTFFQGFLLSAAMILPIGAQNAFVLQQGSKKQYHLMSAFLCTLSDVILISGGVFGGSALLSQSEYLLLLITWGGVAFLLWYGWNAFKTAFTKEIELSQHKNQVKSRWRVIVTLVAVTWLNPHVYLDTFVVLGSIGGQLSAELRPWFTFGAVFASISWFFALSLLAAWFSPILSQVTAQRIINLFVGCVMWFIALQLAAQGWKNLF
ncbi:TPA: arginine exporter ArgO [Proteus mirabilis]|uniref:arginine exporter ArgO n=1 Tax=Proteus mirabilis TaxID=584 RepID=UPI001B90C425|nr:arginine exporter ArgO [Proteus mirabilis]HBC8683136.1 arginine exporter ArgO [Proteus mirabilis]HCR3466294.1 arginine exporter ArgO [Proteus mirabilis]HCR3667211.1 arginine exporter ArgO [Proteus mirabilis]HCU2504109.1 arginine exporter ArgO [Proteus mirabilis]HEJ9730268.1 arginine exporter ArgO [Proteus mirabilis]